MLLSSYEAAASVVQIMTETLVGRKGIQWFVISKSVWLGFRGCFVAACYSAPVRKLFTNVLKGKTVAELEPGS
jgi:hypothetical protein